jgi:sugar/nucleoside kinase (ribokinase family)
MPITAVGSIAYDAVKTPFGKRERMLGGAAVHIALAARFFDEVRIVGPVGDDRVTTHPHLCATATTKTRRDSNGCAIASRGLTLHGFPHGRSEDP